LRHESVNKQLVLTDISLANPIDAAKGSVVDLDPIDVKWSANGEPEDIQVYLESVQSGIRTDPIKGRSTENVIRFLPAGYRAILANREKGSTNRIRAVIQGKDRTFSSDPVNIAVGFTILTVLDDAARLTVAAMIDNSRIPPFTLPGESRSPCSASEPTASCGRSGHPLPVQIHQDRQTQGIRLG
jgi:hypothetical protein